MDRPVARGVQEARCTHPPIWQKVHFWPQSGPKIEFFCRRVGGWVGGEDTVRFKKFTFGGFRTSPDSILATSLSMDVALLHILCQTKVKRLCCCRFTVNKIFAWMQKNVVKVLAPWRILQRISYVDVPAGLENFDSRYTLFCLHLPPVHIPTSLQ